MFKIREMTLKDMEYAVTWAAKEGWNPGLNDSMCFYNTDPSGFFIGELNGEPIGCISAVAYDAYFGFVGFYIVIPEYRDQGYGIQLWNRAMQYLGDRNIGLDGVVEQQDNYKKSGFKLAYRNIRFEGISKEVSVHHRYIKAIKDISIDEVLKYDHQLFPTHRDAFMRNWVEQSEHITLVAFDSNELKGYGVIRPCQSGYKIGPLYAHSPKIAQALLESLISKIEAGKPFFLDVPEVNSSAVQLAKDNDMSKVFETARMYTKDVKELLVDNRVYGVTTFELG